MECSHCLCAVSVWRCSWSAVTVSVLPVDGAVDGVQSRSRCCQWVSLQAEWSHPEPLPAGEPMYRLQFLCRARRFRRRSPSVDVFNGFNVKEPAPIVASEAAGRTRPPRARLLSFRPRGRHERLCRERRAPDNDNDNTGDTRTRDPCAHHRPGEDSGGRGPAAGSAVRPHRGWRLARPGPASPMLTAG